VGLQFWIADLARHRALAQPHAARAPAGRLWPLAAALDDPAHAAPATRDAATALEPQLHRFAAAEEASVAAVAQGLAGGGAPHGPSTSGRDGKAGQPHSKRARRVYQRPSDAARVGELLCGAKAMPGSPDATGRCGAFALYALWHAAQWLEGRRAAGQGAAAPAGRQGGGRAARQGGWVTGLLGRCGLGGAARAADPAAPSEEALDEALE
jgi:hypothetical protein